jgi:hypothetical protein
MKSTIPFAKGLIIATVLVLAFIFAFPTGSFAQDKTGQGKDEETITLKIVKDDNGKVTVIDTTIITTRGQGKSLKYEYTVRDYEKQRAQLEDQMRDLEKDMQEFNIEVMVGDEMKDIDSIVWVGDSIKKHIIIRGMGPGGMNRAPHGEMFFGDEDCIQRFNWNGDCEDVFMTRPPVSPQLESLLQSIPMGKITGFQIKDRKDGKRIIIDIDDEAPIMFVAPYRHSGRNMGAKKIIIERDMEDMQVPPPPPPPPPPDKQ